CNKNWIYVSCLFGYAAVAANSPLYDTVKADWSANHTASTKTTAFKAAILYINQVRQDGECQFDLSETRNAKAGTSFSISFRGAARSIGEVHLYSGSTAKDPFSEGSLQFATPNRGPIPIGPKNLTVDIELDKERKAITEIRAIRPINFRGYTVQCY